MNKLSFHEYMIGVLNVEQKCRVCLKRGQLRSIYSNYYGNVTINEMLKKLNCIVESTTSQQICSTCLLKVIRAYELIKSFDQSTKYFKSLTPHFNENFNNGNNYFFDSLKKKSAHRKVIAELLKEYCGNSAQSKKKNKNGKDDIIDLKSFAALPKHFTIQNKDDIKIFNTVLAELQPECHLNDNNIPQFVVSTLPSQSGNESKYAVTSSLTNKQTSCSTSLPQLTENEPHIVVDNINIQKETKSNMSPNKKSTSAKSSSLKPVASCSSLPDLTGNEKILENKNIKPNKNRKCRSKSKYSQISLKPTTCMDSLPDLSGNEKSCNLKVKTNILKPQDLDKDTNKKITDVENTDFDIINSCLDSLPPLDDFTENEENYNLKNENNIQKEKTLDKSSNNNSTYGENCYNPVTPYLNSSSLPDLTENVETYNLEVENNIQIPQNSDKNSINNNLESLLDLWDFDIDKLEYTANPENTLDNKNHSNQSEILANIENKSKSNVEPITFETDRFPGCVVDQNMNDILNASNPCQSVINEIINTPEDDKNQKKNNLGDEDCSSTVISEVISLSSTESITCYVKNLPEILENKEKNINKDKIYNPVVEKPKRKIKISNCKTSNSSKNENITVQEPSQKALKRKLPEKIPKTDSKKPKKKETERIAVNGKNVNKLKPSLKPAVNVEVMSKTEKVKNKTPAKNENSIKPAVNVEMSKTQNLKKTTTKKSIKPAGNVEVMSKTQKLEKTPRKKEKSIKKCIEKKYLDNFVEKNPVTYSKVCVDKQNKKCKIITKTKNKDVDNPDKKTVISISKTIDMNKLKTSKLTEEKTKNLEKNTPHAHDCAKYRLKNKIRELELTNIKGTLVVTPAAVEDLLKDKLDKSVLVPTDLKNTTDFIKTKVLICNSCKKLCLTESILEAHTCILEE